jgi:predicted GNAT family acetyltransferase
VECLYLSIDALETRTIERAIRVGATLTDLRLTLSAHSSAFPQLEDGRTRRAADDELRQLEGLARNLAAESRFARDSRFAPEAVARMYELWSARCLENGVVVVPAGTLCGFVGAVDDPTGARIELVYVSPDGRGHGLAAAMVVDAARALGAAEVTVVTQAGNLAAQRVYQSVGFRTRGSEALLHLWFDDASTEAP